MKQIRVGNAWLSDVETTPPDGAGFAVSLQRWHATLLSEKEATAIAEFLRDCGVPFEILEAQMVFNPAISR